MSKDNQIDQMSLRSEQIVNDFIEQFQKKEITINKEARNMILKDPEGNDNDLVSLIANLITKYIGSVDGFKSFILLQNQHPEIHDSEILVTHIKERTKTLAGLFHAINLARSHNLIEDGSEKKLNELTQENAKLKKRIEILSNQLKTCDEELTLIRKFVHGVPKGTKEYGDVEE